MSAGRDTMDAVFACARCGECCRGAGGIVLLARDAERLASWLGLAPDDFFARYTERVGRKIRLGCGTDGSCIFLKEDGCCGVHGARPEICRAWPFFRGNMVDAVSLAMAGEGCPGIRQGVSFSTFTRAGADYLLEHDIVVAETDPASPSALMPEGMVRRMARNGSGCGEG